MAGLGTHGDQHPLLHNVVLGPRCLTGATQSSAAWKPGLFEKFLRTLASHWAEVLPNRTLVWRVSVVYALEDGPLTNIEYHLSPPESDRLRLVLNIADNFLRPWGWLVRQSPAAFMESVSTPPLKF